MSLSRGGMQDLGHWEEQDSWSLPRTGKDRKNVHCYSKAAAAAADLVKI